MIGVLHLRFEGHTRWPRAWFLPTSPLTAALVAAVTGHAALPDLLLPAQERPLFPEYR